MIIPERRLAVLTLRKKITGLALSLVLAAMLTLGSLHIALAISLDSSQDRSGLLGGKDGSAVQLLQADEYSIEIELSLSPNDYSLSQDLSRQCTRVKISTGEGEPFQSMTASPERSVLVGIPSNALVQLEILDAENVEQAAGYPPCHEQPFLSEIDLSNRIRLAPDDLAVQAAARLATGRDTYDRQNSMASGSDCLPQICQPIELGTEGYIRSQRVAQVTFRPFLFDPQARTLRIFHRLRARLHFSPISPPASEQFEAQPAGFEQILHDNLINYEQAKAWRKPGSPSSIETAGQPVSLPTKYKIELQQEGLYALGYADFIHAGIPVAQVDPSTLALTNLGKRVAITLTGDMDNQFEPGEQLLFYGETIHSKYTRTNVYWLGWNNPTSTWMTSLDASPLVGSSVVVTGAADLHLENNHLYLTSLASGPDQDHWYWDGLNAQRGANSRTYTFTLPELTNGAYTATLAGLLKGYASDPYHHTRLLVNQHPLTDSIWYGQQDYTFSAAFPQSWLQNGVNSLTVMCGVGDNITETILVNHFDLRYIRSLTSQNNSLKFLEAETGERTYRVGGFSQDNIEVYDLRNPRQPVLLQKTQVQAANGGYQVTFKHLTTSEDRFLVQAEDRRISPDRFYAVNTQDLWDSRNQADYILITPGELITAAQELSDYRTARGLHAFVVNTQDIYDQFNQGIFDPRAIRSFLAYAYTSWFPPAPAYVLLFGDGNYDYLDYLGRGQPQLVPPYLADVDPWIGETANDNYFAAVSGDDPLPDLHLGRLALRTPQEAHAAVGKIIAYETSLAPWKWNRQVLFVADQADQAGDFPQLSDTAASSLPGDSQVQRVYLGVTHPTQTTAHQAILNALNQGQALVNYVGHGSVQNWSASDLLTVNDLPSLHNAIDLPFILPMTCLEGYFIHPSLPDKDLSSLAESITRLPAGGAIASFSPTGFGVASGHDYLNRGILQAIFTTGQWQIGPAATQAKIYLYSSTPNYHDLLETYLLFGDPALRLRLEKPSIIHFPLLRLETPTIIHFPLLNLKHSRP